MGKVFELQNPFFNVIRTNRVPVAIYLVNGIKLQGLITSFDRHTLKLNHSEVQDQLVYKHAIATVVPRQKIELPLAAVEELSQEKTQDAFLDAIKEANKWVNVYLMNGIKLEGCVFAHDGYTLILDNNKTSQLAYKHAIATVVIPK